MMETDDQSQDIGQKAPALEGRDILCFSHDWTGDPLSKTHLMRLLAKKNRILWVNSIGYRAPTVSKADAARAWKKLKAATESIREVEKNIFVLNPLAIPAYGKSWVRKLNKRLLKFQVKRAMRKLGFRNVVNWTFNPAAAILAGALGEQSLIYYCVDEYSALAGVNAQSLKEMDLTLVEKADYVFVSSRPLYESRSQLRTPVHLVRHGVQFEHFRAALDNDLALPKEVATLPHPMIGYFGLMSPDWIDLELLIAVAERYRHGSLVLLGTEAMDLSRLRQFPNVHILGRKPFETLPGYCKAFDVGIVPFPVSELTRSANPLKAREYVAAGLPVVSTDIPEAREVSYCRVANTHQQFLDELQDALQDETPRAVRSEAMRNESWAARFEQISNILSGRRGGSGAYDIHETVASE